MSALPRPCRLFLLSFLMLFVELALIRWTGAKVVYLSYFSNFVLLASFLGIGVGFLRARSATNLFSLAPVLLAVMVGFVIVFPVQINRSGSDLIFFGALENSGTGLPIWATLPVIFVAVAVVMMSIAQGVARTFAELDPLRAYQLDIMGSIAGVRVRALWPVYALLIGALALAWLVPPESLLGLPLLPRFIIATLLAFIPIFLANLLFAERFKDVASSTVAFGANLLGAMIGGVLEYGALVTGYRALLPLIAALYVAALLLDLRPRGVGVAA